MKALDSIWEISVEMLLFADGVVRSVIGTLISGWTSTPVGA